MINVRIAVEVMLAVAVTASALASEPSSSTPPGADTGNSSQASAQSTDEPAAQNPPPRPPLKLQIGDVRSYMMPSEYRAAIDALDADRTAIVVEGERPPPPLKSTQPVPVGIATPFWMLAHPLKAWRALLPDPNAPPPGPPDVVPQRELRLGP